MGPLGSANLSRNGNLVLLARSPSFVCLVARIGAAQRVLFAGKVTSLRLQGRSFASKSTGVAFSDHERTELAMEYDDQGMHTK